MFIEPAILQSVVYVAVQKDDGDFAYIGSAFIVGQVQRPGYAEPVFFATARHVIAGARDLGARYIHLRLDVRDQLEFTGTSVSARESLVWARTDITDWFEHPTENIDAAIIELGIHNSLNHYVFPLQLGVRSILLAAAKDVLGAEVFIAGLFKHYIGTSRNTPIVRIGNLACVTEEPIFTDMGHITGHLIEARSIGGLSGSPVFIHLPKASPKLTGHPEIEADFAILGLIHGHYDESTSTVDVEDANGKQSGRVNTGIAIVTPFEKLLDVINAFLDAGRKPAVILGDGTISRESVTPPSPKS